MNLPATDLPDAMAARITSIGTGQVNPAATRELRAAEHGKHLLLLAGVRKKAESTEPPDQLALLGHAYSILIKVEEHAPDLLAEVLTLPQFGGWAASYISADNTATPRPPTAGIGYFCVLASTAAVRAGISFSLPVPLVGDTVTLPGLGRLLVPIPPSGDWVRIRADMPGELIVEAASAQATINIQNPSEIWTPTPRIHVLANDLPLDLLLDTEEQLTSRLGVRTDQTLPASSPENSKPLAEAWQILTQRHRPVAESMAECLRTLVPLPPGEVGSTPSGTSGWLWGAIAVGLPADSSSLAEALVHEFHHLLLAALEDQVTLIERDSERSMYAPWRDDPRPLSGLLHGAYANVAMAGFWRTEAQAAKAGGLSNALRAEIEFAWRRSAVSSILRNLATADGLSPDGRLFLASMSQWLNELGAEQVSPTAQRFADELTMEHRLRWRLAHLSVDSRAIEKLAHAWSLAKGPHVRLPWPEAQVVPAATIHGSSLHDLMTMRTRAPHDFPDRLKKPHSINPLDRAILDGDYQTAYRIATARLMKNPSPPAWVALAIASTNLDNATAFRGLVAFPEVVAGVYERVRENVGDPPSVKEFIERLADLTAQP